MATTFIAWQLASWGLPYSLTFGLTVVIAFLIGTAIQGIVMPLGGAESGIGGRVR